MEVQSVRLILNRVRLVRGKWSVCAHGTFTEGIHLITGEVGSGKSTLALVLAGLFSPASGTVVRENISSLMISFQFPEYHLTGTTVNEECRSWGRDPALVLDAAHLYGKGDTSPLKMSRGELKRLHLACVLAGDYDLLILDEPFSSLDCREKERMCRILSRRSRGITLIFTHEQTTFPRVDQIWEIHNGKLCNLGGMPEALQQWQQIPSVIKDLIASGKIPGNLSQEDILEAACRT
jgi:energy-coupling factor transport system ATP-binding protein